MRNIQCVKNYAELSRHLHICPSVQRQKQALPGSLIFSFVPRSSKSRSNSVENLGRNERTPDGHTNASPALCCRDNNGRADKLTSVSFWEDEQIVTKAFELFSSIPLRAEGVLRVRGCFVIMMSFWAASSGDKVKSIFRYFLDLALNRAFGHLEDHGLWFRANTFSSELIYRLNSPIRGEHLL